LIEKMGKGQEKRPNDTDLVCAHFCFFALKTYHEQNIVCMKAFIPKKTEMNTVRLDGWIDR